MCGPLVQVHLEDGRQLRGLIPHAHLSDHPVGAAAIREAISPGSSLGQMIVLELVAHGNMLLLSRKQALVRAAESLPATFEEVKESALLPGYVASVTADAVYIRFLGRVTGMHLSL